jgi:parallel beta-helix repeat protein
VGWSLEKKRSFSISLIFLIVSAVFSTLVSCQVRAAPDGVSTNHIVLADAINSCILNWTTDATTAKFAMVFNALPLSYYDTIIQQCASKNDWIEVLRVKRFSEIDGYDSPIIEQAAYQALVNMPMLENLPLTSSIDGNPYFDVYYRFILNAYRYADQYNLTQKWNATAAYQELLATYESASQPSIGYNSLNLTTFQWTPRYYDEAAETLDSFVELGGNDVGLWNYIQNSYWNGNIYGYNGPNQYECEVGFFAMVMGNYYVSMGGNLANFDRIFMDLYNKLLAQGWNSVGWGVPGVLRHAESNPQLRLENTLGAIQALQAYVGMSDWEPAFVDLLSGSDQAWSALMNSSLRSGGRFSGTSDGSISDDATAEGMMTLFLEGIIPNTGSLAMPLDEEAYQDVCDLSPASLFGFDYANRTICIPVNPGELEFQFGTQVVSCVFPSAGIYQVDFGNNWNSIIGVKYVGPLDSQFKYLNAQARKAIVICADGSLSPPTTPIDTTDNVTYTFAGKLDEEIVVQRNNIVIDGNGYTLRGSGSEIGLSLPGVSNVTIRNTMIINFTYGIWLDFSYDSTLSSNSATTNQCLGIYLGHSSNNTLSGNNVTTNNGDGIKLEYSSDNNTLSGNNVAVNRGDGIFLDRSNNNILRNNEAMANNETGIYLLFSSHNALFSNNVTTNKGDGVGLRSSSGNVLSSNVIRDSGYNFGVFGSFLSDFMNSIDTSNLVDAKPICYVTSKSNLIISPQNYPDSGYVAVINCTNVTVQDFTLTHDEQGILLAFTNNSKVTGNNMTNNRNGIELFSSSNDTLSGNYMANNNLDGCLLERSSDYNTLLGNTISANSQDGIELSFSSNNKIFHNFFNNTWQAFVSGLNNTWDDGYPSGGNYWSNYLTYHPNATEIGRSGMWSSGIWNTPYVIDPNNVDHYPLTKSPTGPGLMTYLVIDGLAWIIVGLSGFFFIRSRKTCTDVPASPESHDVAQAER